MIDESVRAFMEGAVDAIRDHYSNIIRGLSDRLENFELKLQKLPIPEKGDKGDPGKSGSDGRNGIDGKDGAPGAPGPKGERGEKGEQGPKGNPGESGSAGPMGEKGQPGEIGPRGESGIQGPKGDSGERGTQGAKGDAGEKGEAGPKGDRGDKGEKGESITGPPGKDGAAGRDAIQLDIVPSIDLARSYPRNTYARYQGGIIRSFRDTVPAESIEKAGWEVVVCGISDISVSLGEDLRTFEISICKTAGEKIAKQFTLPVLIYRGVYEANSAYQIGDVVTWGGSAWHCQSNNPKSAPHDSDEWKLMVKEGRRGKDGKDGERGLQGNPGRDGKIVIGDSQAEAQ